jgi:phospho-N-acetylmuramoyl-pentapeptide-transferase
MNALIFMVTFLVTVAAYPPFIRRMDAMNQHQSVSAYSLEQFKTKKKTPTMGGIVFITIPLLAAFFVHPTSFLDLRMAVVYLTFAGYGLIGFLDDYIIVIKKDNAGLKPSHKFMAQLVLAVGVYLIYRSFADSSVLIPLIDQTLDLGWIYVGLVFFMFTGASNAVNLTDGMDGLAGGTVWIALFGFWLINHDANLILGHFLLMVLGSLAGYLVYNLYPAKIIMGDTGSLALGALLAVIAMVMKQEALLVIIGIVFVVETLCVILQIGSVKLFKRRIFKYTPIHYSFTLSGWKEKQVVALFWAVGLMGLLLGLWLA